MMTAGTNRHASGAREEAPANVRPGSKDAAHDVSASAAVLDHPMLPDALAHCKRITRTRARNFYYGLKLLPEPQRSAMYALYAWMRAADDLVDASGESGSASNCGAACVSRFDSFRHATASALAGRVPNDDPMWLGLAYAAARFNLPEQPFRAMLAGQRDDLAEREYQTFEELRQYCYRVASTVGLLCIRVWGTVASGGSAPTAADNMPDASTLAVERGIAFQLTNILRDFKEDYDLGRVYLPLQDFHAHELIPSDLRAWTHPDRCRAFLLEQIARAKAFYQRSEPLDQLITPSCRPTLWAMTSIYHGLLERIKADPAALVSNERIRLNVATKSIIALRARFGWFST